ncbi:RHS repeat-associated core domain-containing protein [Dyella subtropica]|uniref:RHS repeat-associated core domain-containing protein n=1 Tax=Dyella subtropica TaxID=2992127 RepID=UPI002253CA92|nr:RHS repeat-associated core domain-containing protein [Dyella subtropica]
MFRPDGKQETFNKANGQWTADPDVPDVLTETDNAQGVATGFTVFVAALRHFETYDTNGLLQAVTDETGQGINLTYSTTLTDPAVAPKPGLLLTVTDTNGRQLGFTYDSNAHVHRITQPDAGTLTYTYDVGGNLLSVQYPDGKSRQYVYNESSLTGSTNLPNAMTGIVDEAGVRYENTQFDSTGRATSSSFAGNVDTTSITYNSDGTSTVLYPLGVTSTQGFSTIQGLVRVATLDHPCDPACGQPWQTRTYDANGYPATATDFNGNITATAYSSTGLLTQAIEARGQSNQRTINTTWNTTLRVPLTRTVLDNSGATVASTAWVYNAFGQVQARCEIDPAVAGATSYTCAASGTPPTGVRRRTYTYCTAIDTSQCPLVGLLLSVAGPRTDVSDAVTYSYYLTDSATARHGDLKSVTDALGHVTTYNTYDGAGRVTRLTDANGVITDLTYMPRGLLQTRIVRASPSGAASSGDATTTIAYTPYAAVASITDPDGVTVSYTYDAAHRLTDLTDALGNRIHYTLDAAGNKTKEETFDAANTLRRSLARTYNTLGQLTGLTDGLSHTVFNASFADSYDANGNLVHTADALGIQRKQGYDGLNRLVSTLDNYNGTDSATQNTQSVFAYDARDQLLGVGDPDGLNTTYDYDGLSNPKAVHSPDTGTTAYVVDAAGNRTQQTDAKGNVSTSSYDALNRRIATTYTDPTLNVGYTYDEANSVTGCSSSSPVGRLTRVIENAVTTVFCYDARGNVIQKRQVQSTQTDVTQYSYTLGDRLSSVITPSTTATQYMRDGAGRVTTVTVTPPGTSAGTAVSGITYLPFGPIASYTLGNGQTVTRSYDANYALTDVTSPALNLHFARDAMGNPTALGNAPGANPAVESYAYDPLYRLTGVNNASGAAIEAYTYSKTGDRLSKTASGLATGTYGYQSGTHWLTSIGTSARSYDANGNTTGSAAGGDTYGYGYNGRNRLTVVQRNGQTVASYSYNVLGQRIAKSVTLPQAISQRFAYDESSQLIGEYGTVNRDYIWLGDLPVAVVDTTGTTSTVSYVHADGLNTTRAITDATGAAIWQWSYQGNPFGEQQPTSSNGYVFNLRFPGQYYDAESGQYYNQQRDYDPLTGRYKQSDPIGLMGGISTYAYVGSDPVDYYDPSGLMVKVVASDPVAAQILINAYAELNSRSATARAINSDLEKSSTVFEIRPTGDMDNDKYCPSSDYLGCEGHPHTVFVDICDFPSIPTTAGMQPITLPVLIGHELGHAWGYSDNPSATDPLGDNVRMVENPIRQEMGLPLRTSYGRK